MSSETVAPAHRAGPSRRGADSWARLLRPAAPRTPAAEIAVVVVLGAVVAALRLPPRALAVPWGEDGSRWLPDAHGSGLLAVLLEPYAGYAQTTQRVIGEVVSHLPLRLEGTAISLGGAGVQALVAALVYLTVRAHTRRRWLAALGALWVVAVPVGLEVVDNTANAPWFVLLAALLLPLWRPRTRFGVVVASLVCLLAVTTTPFAVAGVVLGLAVLVVTRDRRLVPVVLAGIVGSALQAVAVLSSPARAPGQFPATPSLPVRAWLRRVAGDAFTGTGRYGSRVVAANGLHVDVRIGLVVVAVVVVLGLLTLRARGAQALVVPAVLLVMSFGLYSALLLIASPPTFTPVASGRYAVVPTLLLVLAVLQLIASTLPTPERPGDDHDEPARPGPRTTASRGVAVVLSALVLVVGVGGLVSSYRTQDGLSGRSEVVPWASGVERARERCRGAEDASRTVMIALAPAPTALVLSCRDLLSW